MPVGTSDGEFFEDEFDHSIQTHFEGSVASPVPRTDAFTPPATQVAPGDNNAPATSTRSPGGTLKGNLGDILSMQVDDIPDGVSARDFIRQLQQKTDSQYRKPVITASR